MKKIKLVASEKFAENFKNILPASNFVPGWYKNSKQKIENTNTELCTFKPVATNSTYKRCSPFLDALTSGYMFYLTQDIEVTIKNDGNPYILWRSENRKALTWHDNDQWNGLPNPDGYHNFLYKWHNSFTLTTPEGYSSIFSHPFNRLDLPFYTLSGVVDTDSYNGQVQFPFFLKNNFIGIIEAGTPIAQVNFIKRETWKHEIMPFNEKNNFINNEKLLNKITRSYKNQFWHKKTYE